MPIYQPLIPTGTVNLDVDYLNLQGNFTQLNVVYGTDHYPFDNATPNQGFHNQVTTPAYVASPPTSLPPVTGTSPIFYAFQQYSSLGVLQYSRGPSNAVATPLTSLHSSSTPITLTAGSTTNILDFTGFSIAMCTLQAFNDVAGTGKLALEQPIRFSQNSFGAFSVILGLEAVNSGNILQLKNNTAGTLSGVYWTLQLIRIQ